MKLLKREVAQLWLNGLTASSLEDVPEVMTEIERLKSELNNIPLKWSIGY